MGRQKQLAKNTIILLAGKICTQFVSFLLLPLYTAILATNEYGIVDLINTYIGLLVPIVTLQLENAIFRFLIGERKDPKKISELVSSAFHCLFLELIIYTILFCILQNFMEIPYAGYLFFNIVVCSISSILLQIARGLGDNKGYAVGSFIAAVSTIVFNIIFLVVCKMGAEGMFLAALLANILCVIYLFFKEKVYRYYHFKMAKCKMIKQLLGYSVPLVPNGISWWVINVSDRTIVTTFIGIAANGIYAVSNKFSSIFISIYNIFNLSWTETAVLHMQDPDKDAFFTNTIVTMFKIFSSICLGVLVVLPFVFPILIHSEYKEAYLYIPILLISTLFNVVVGLMSVVYVANKKSKEISKTSIIAAIINIVVNLLLVKKMGIYASAFSTAIAFGIMMIYRYIDIQKYVKIRFGKKLFFKTMGIFTMCITFYYINNTILNCVSMAIALLYAFTLNATLLKQLLPIILSFFKKKENNS